MDAIKEALGAIRDAWQAVHDDDYALDPEAKAAVLSKLDNGIIEIEEAALLASA
jgi:hypothetical protein